MKYEFERALQILFNRPLSPVSKFLYRMKLTEKAEKRENKCDHIWRKFDRNEAKRKCIYCQREEWQFHSLINDGDVTWKRMGPII